MPYKDKQKQRAYQREWMRKRRQEYFADKCCVVCGFTERLELDHIDRATKITHVIWSYTKEKRDAELAKCQPLCYYCHKEKTREDFRKYTDADVLFIRHCTNVPHALLAEIYGCSISVIQDIRYKETHRYLL